MTEETRELLERVRRFAMPAGPTPCKGTWLRQVGEMRFAPDRPWFPFEAEQWFEGEGLDFRWEARARMAPLLRARVTDAFEDGRGRLVARVLGVVPVARSRGPETDKAEAMRGMAELVWRPFAFRESPALAWEAPGPGRLRAIHAAATWRAAVEFEVDAGGRVLGCAARDRPRGTGKQAVETAWSGRFAEYRDFGPLRVPTRGEVAWALPEGGAFTYWRGKVVDFRTL
jgi:hypothetical protein